MIELMQGDCLKRMNEIPDGSVDLILADPPYGTTACKWDSIIPLSDMWEQLKRVLTSSGAIVMTASQPFTSVLILSNLRMFKYCWVWEKNKGSNFGAVRYQPMKEHEDITVFGANRTIYNPQRIKRSVAGMNMVKIPVTSKGHKKGETSVTGNFDKGHSNHHLDIKTRCPRSIIKFNTQVGLHPTQKPVLLMEYMIKTYTNEGNLVLDFCMGSGTTGVACKNLGRDFVGIELDEKYFQLASERIGK